jgi:hypothetical protein
MNKDKWKIHFSDFPPEIRLMLLCMKREMSISQREEAISLISSGIDWKLFYRHVNKHRVLPVVYKNMRTFSADQIDDSVMTALKKKSMQSTGHSLKLSSELVRIAGILNEQEIRFLSLKGPLLSLALFGDMNIRISKDLDLMIDLADLERTDKLLIESGYRRIMPSEIPTGKSRAIFFKNNHHYSYMNDLHVNIELHWKFDYLVFDTAFSRIWEARRTLQVNRTQFYVMNAEEEFLYYVYHGAGHGWNRLRWLSDVAEMIDSNNFDWSIIIKRADQLQMKHALFQAMILCRELMNTTIPEMLAFDVDESRRGRKLAFMAIPIILDTDESHQVRNIKKYTICFLTGLSPKIRYLLMHFDPLDEDIQSIKVSDKFFFLYYVVRPFNWMKRRLFKKHVTQKKGTVSDDR